jgi:maltooligosyltrehalose trehalohydrolase
MTRILTRRLPVGAEVQSGGGTHFRVWAPDARDVALRIETGQGHREVRLEAEADGYHSAHAEQAVTGTRYWYLLDGEAVPDPASRFQPDGPFGPSQVVDPAGYRWHDPAWGGVDLTGQIISEIHIGTFTSDGTWRSATARLPCLAKTGITMLEIMPVADFAGTFGWGYDGVFPYAPTRLYGGPDDFRAFVDQAHQLGIAVILDVVYNHLGPAGCVFRRYAKAYFARKYDTEWGEALNFDGQGSAAVREYFIANAGYWIDEFHLDGLRLDATQSIHDASPEHVITALARQARAAAGERQIVIVAENEPQHTRLVRPVDAGGFGLDALWNDDFHHSAVVAVTGRREAYYTDYAGAPQEFVSAAKYGYLFQGQRYAWQKQARGTSARGLGPVAFVNFVENHDQLANSGAGMRLHARTSPGRYRALTALLLLLPGTPMLFQGQEFGASAPFLYFADHEPELAELVRKGRAEFVTQFPSLAAPEMRAGLEAPDARATFERCALDWNEAERHTTHVRLHRDLIAVRRADAAFKQQAPGGLDGAVLAPEAFALRYFAGAPADERLLLVNFGPDLVAGGFPEPLLAPPDGCRWVLRWSSEDPAYGGGGTPGVATADGWRISGHAAVVLRPEPVAPATAEATDGGVGSQRA